jgi:hypothetical protein
MGENEVGVVRDERGQGLKRLFMLKQGAMDLVGKLKAC